MFEYKFVESYQIYSKKKYCKNLLMLKKLLFMFKSSISGHKKDHPPNFPHIVIPGIHRAF
jgi:hypothetical protein